MDLPLNIRWIARGPVALLAAALALGLPGILSAQAAPFRVEPVAFASRDSTPLQGSIARPVSPAPGPRPGVVLITVGFSDPLVERLTRAGYTVLSPERRWLRVVDRLLQTRLPSLADDVRSAVEYLRARPEVGTQPVAVVAQGDDARAALRAVGESLQALPLVLLAPPLLPGPEGFRVEQLGMARAQGWTSRDVARLDALLERISLTVLEEASPYARAYRLEAVLDDADARLPHNFAFPDEDSQIRVFSSPWWADFLAFDPERALGSLQGPALVLLGDGDPFVPPDRALAAARRGLARAPTRDATVCLVPGRTRQTFTESTAASITEWLAQRFAGRGGEPACLPDPKGAA